ncbi:putative glycoside hydrolase [Tsukamurella sp. 8F]|uniref:putative glycoside hydrolase n=1 Tax=Tsukamurella sp. 8F TaxID=3031961 RepID=UPI0023B9ACC8|nr:putative glycoside hydrolase [Tsukamurella sp. 8F]MDF0587190.1 putative glycoside hydrolase [Tsukamurella sp. 8F]
MRSWGWGMRVSASVAAVAASVLATGCAAADPAPGNPVCGFWYAIGQTPTTEQIDSVAKSVSIVVLNAWDTDARARLKADNPAATALVYKDMSSTRNYAGAVTAGKDDAKLPSGVGYVAAPQSWFATGADGARIQWKQYPGHWQMAVWSPGYRTAWVNAVSGEVAADGWDGVLADNDLSTLSVYSPELLRGTRTHAATDARLTSGLTSLVNAAGTELQSKGKLFVPNIASARLGDPRWNSHSRFGGAMAEFFTSAEGKTAQLGDFTSAAVAPGNGEYRLLITQADNDAERETGYATAALVSTPKTCWTSAQNGDYKAVPDTKYTSLPLGAATGQASAAADGVWQRTFSGGRVVVNPTGKPAAVAVGPGEHRPDGSAPPMTLPARTGWVLLG